MVVQAYILIQTEVGKAADVAKSIAEVKRCDARRGRDRSVRRDRPRRGPQRRRAGQARRRARCRPSTASPAPSPARSSTSERSVSRVCPRRPTARASRPRSGSASLMSRRRRVLRGCSAGCSARPVDGSTPPDRRSRRGRVLRAARRRAARRGRSTSRVATSNPPTRLAAAWGRSGDRAALRRRPSLRR